MIQYVPHVSIIIGVLVILNQIGLDQANTTHIWASRAFLAVCTLIFALFFLRATKNVELQPGTPESKLDKRVEISGQWKGLIGRVVVVLLLHLYTGKLEPLIISNFVGFMLLQANKKMVSYIKGEFDEEEDKKKE